MQYFDGGSRGNPGEAGCGAALFTGEGRGMPVATRSAYLGKATSNEAEYQGLIMGLQLAVSRGAREVAIRGDSKLVINQLLGTWQVPLWRLCKLLVASSSRPCIAWQHAAPHLRRVLCAPCLTVVDAACCDVHRMDRNKFLLSFMSTP